METGENKEVENELENYENIDLHGVSVLCPELRMREILFNYQNLLEDDVKALHSFNIAINTILEDTVNISYWREVLTRGNNR